MSTTVTLKQEAVDSAGCFYRSNTAYWALNYQIEFGAYDATYYGYQSGLRFIKTSGGSAHTIPQGTQLTSATLRLKAKDSASGTGCKAKVQCEDSDDAAVYSTQSDYTGRTLNSATSTLGTLGSWTANTWYEYDVKTAVQAVLDRSGWGAGKAINLRILDNASTKSGSGTNLRDAYDGVLTGTSSDAPELVLVWADATTQTATGDFDASGDVAQTATGDFTAAVATQQTATGDFFAAGRVSVTGDFAAQVGTPTGVTLSVNEDYGIVTWDAVTGATGYKVYRDGTLYATLGNVTRYENIFLAGSASFTVKALATGVEGAQSSAATGTFTLHRGTRWFGTTAFHSGGYLPNNQNIGAMVSVGTSCNKVIDWITFETSGTGYFTHLPTPYTYTLPSSYDTRVRATKKVASQRSLFEAGATARIEMSSAGYFQLRAGTYYYNGSTWGTTATDTTIPWSLDTPYYLRIVGNGTTTRFIVSTNVDYSSPLLDVTRTYAQSSGDVTLASYGTDRTQWSAFEWNHHETPDLTSDGATVADVYSRGEVGLRDGCKQCQGFEMPNGDYVVSWLASNDHSASNNGGSQGWMAHYSNGGTLLRGPHVVNAIRGSMNPAWVSRPLDASVVPGRVWDFFNVKVVGSGSSSSERDDGYFRYSDNNGLHFSDPIALWTSVPNSKSLRCNGITLRNGSNAGDTLIPLGTNDGWSYSPDTDTQGVYSCAAASDGSSAGHWTDYVTGGIAHNATSGGTEPTIAEIPPATCSANGWPNGTLCMLGRDDNNTAGKPLYGLSYDGGHTWTNATYSAWNANKVSGTVTYADFAGPNVITAITDWDTGEIIAMNYDASAYQYYPLVLRRNTTGKEVGSHTHIDVDDGTWLYGESCVLLQEGSTRKLFTMAKFGTASYNSASTIVKLSVIFDAPPTIGNVTGDFSAYKTQTADATGDFAATATVQQTATGDQHASRVTAADASGDFHASKTLESTIGGDFAAQGTTEQSVTGDFIAQAAGDHTITGDFAAQATTQQTATGDFAAAAAGTTNQNATGDFAASGTTAHTITGDFAAGSPETYHRHMTGSARSASLAGGKSRSAALPGGASTTTAPLDGSATWQN